MDVDVITTEKKKKTEEVTVAQLTADEREELMKTGGCFYCHQRGHKAQACPKKQNDRRITSKNPPKKSWWEKPQEKKYDRNSASKAIRNMQFKNEEESEAFREEMKQLLLTGEIEEEPENEDKEEEEEAEDRDFS